MLRLSCKYCACTYLVTWRSHNNNYGLLLWLLLLLFSFNVASILCTTCFVVEKLFLCPIIVQLIYRQKRVPKTTPFTYKLLVCSQLGPMEIDAGQEHATMDPACEELHQPYAAADPDSIETDVADADAELVETEPHKDLRATRLLCEARRTMLCRPRCSI